MTVNRTSRRRYALAVSLLVYGHHAGIQIRMVQALPLLGTSPSPRTHESNTRLSVFGWFFGDKSRDEKNSLITRDGKGVVNIMDGMEAFKKSQRIGSKTNNLIQELTSTQVEGSSPDGKVKVTLDAQQNPIRVNIEEQYFQSTDVLDMSNSILAAMKDAHEKATDKMQEKSKAFFQDMGIVQGKDSQ